MAPRIVIQLSDCHILGEDGVKYHPPGRRHIQERQRYMKSSPPELPALLPSAHDTQHQPPAQLLSASTSG